MSNIWQVLRTWSRLFVASLLFAACSAPATTSSSVGSSPQVSAMPSGQLRMPRGLGESFQSGNWEYKVIDAWRVWELGSGRSALRPTGQWIMVPISLTNRGNRPFGIGFQDFELEDECRVRYAPDVSSSLLAEYSNEFRALSSFDQYPPDVEFRTILFFDITPQRQTFTLRLLQTQEIVPLGPVRLARSPGTPPSRTFQPSPCR